MRRESSCRCWWWRRGAGVVIAVLVSVLGTAGAAADEQPPGAPAEETIGCGKAQAMLRQRLAEETDAGRAADYAAMFAAGVREAPQDTDVLHCNVELEVIPSQTTNLYGTNVLTIRSKSSALTQVTLRLRSQYTITSALVNGSIPVTVSTVGTTTRLVTLDRTYGMDEEFTLTIAYNGQAVSGGFGSIQFTTHNGANIVTTLSEPYFSYTWWPVKDGDLYQAGDNGDKFTLELAVVAPTGMVSASNGALQGVDTLSGNRQRYRWASDYAVSPYLVFFSSTNYNSWQVNYNTLAGGTMPVLFYIYPESDNSSNRTAWQKAVAALYVFRDLFGEYPFTDEKYGIYQFPFSGGMEHQTFTGQGVFSEGVTVHELAHQWWGDLVTCKTWNHIWLNEGFARYGEALWAQYKSGSTGLPALKSAMAGFKYTGSGTVYVQNTELGDPNAIFDGNTTYNKASWVVHMLRHVLGDTNFFATLAAYRSAFEFSAATTEDFQAVCEGFYPGGDLSWFFQEWVYGQRCPAYSWGWTSVQVRGKHYLLVYVDQTQSVSIQRFTMPIDLVVNGATKTIFNDADPEYFVVPLAAAATTVQFDPDEWILTSGKSSTSYVAGPPKIVETAPLPGASISPTAGLDEVTVTFHTAVNTSAAHYTLTGATTGAQTFSYAYSGGPDNTVTLTCAGPLPPDEYTLTVSDLLTAINSGQTLDGEITDPNDPSSLPSGDGQAGGSAAIHFTVRAPVPGDVNDDGDVDLADWAGFVDCVTGPAGGILSGCGPADLDADSDVDLLDMAAFAAYFPG